MAIQTGEVRVKGKTVGYFQYSRTAGMALTRIYPTAENLASNWRTQDHERECKCSLASVEVALSTENELFLGHTWKSKACLDCQAIVGNPDPTDAVGAAMSLYYSDDIIEQCKKEWGWID